MRALYREPELRKPAGMARDSDVRALAFDVFGTTVDWCGGIAREAKAMLEPVLAKYGGSSSWPPFPTPTSPWLSRWPSERLSKVEQRRPTGYRRGARCAGWLAPVRPQISHSRLLARAMNPIVTSPIGTITALRAKQRCLDPLVGVQRIPGDRREDSDRIEQAPAGERHGEQAGQQGRHDERDN